MGNIFRQDSNYGQDNKRTEIDWKRKSSLDQNNLSTRSLLKPPIASIKNAELMLQFVFKKKCC
uniref:Uncharacterized protein n=1 Tax=Arundo donax TaxID=35708 RepID=A0A0A8Z884_ARUDO